MKWTTFALIGGLLVGASGFALAQAVPPPQNSPATQVPNQTEKPRTDMPARTAETSALPSGFMNASKLVGLNVYDPEDKSIGEIRDIVLSGRGEAQTAILNVGGVLGIGSRAVGLSWSEIQFKTEGETLKAVVGLSLDQLKALPEYRSERGAWVLTN